MDGCRYRLRGCRDREIGDFEHSRRAMLIRTRAQKDIPVLVDMANAVRAVDHWPPHRVSSMEDFVVGADPLSALVAVYNSTLLGHVALQEGSADSVMLLAADSLGVGVASLAVVARLFVDPRRRRSGVGKALLDAAAVEATRLHKHPILDVWTELDHAIRLYEVAGWRRLGSVVFSFRSPCGPDCLHEGSSLASFVYAAPPSAAPGR